MFEEFTLAAAVDSLDRLERIPTDAHAIEFRMDLAEAPLEQLDRYDEGVPIIVTNRAEWEGGEATEEGRIEALTTAIDHPCVGAVDIELESIEQGDADTLIDAATDASVDVIASWHDFDETPPADILQTRLRRAARLGNIGKAAVTAHTPRDVLTLLDVTDRLHQNGHAIATMSMGDAGRHSRVIAPLYGSKIAYAPPSSGAATAPGQFDIETLAQLINALD